MEAQMLTSFVKLVIMLECRWTKCIELAESILRNNKRTIFILWCVLEYEDENFLRYPRTICRVLSEVSWEIIQDTYFSRGAFLVTPRTFWYNLVRSVACALKSAKKRDKNDLFMWSFLGQAENFVIYPRTVRRVCYEVSVALRECEGLYFTWDGAITLRESVRNINVS